MAAEGSAAVSMRQLARACDLNVATLYHYFPSKADLLRSVIVDRNYVELLQVGLPVDAALPPRERLAGLLRAIWAGAVHEQEVWRLVIGESLRATDAATEVVADLVDALRSALTDWVTDGFPELAAKGIDSGTAADLLSGQVFGFFIEILVVPRSDAAATEAYLSERADQLAAYVFPA